MRAALWLALLALATLPALGSADFHPVCTGIATGYANVGLEADATGSTFTFRGIVNCPSAVVTITSLELVRVDGDAETWVAAASGDPCAASPCILEGTAPAGAAGAYDVRMAFDVDDPDTAHVDYEDVPRHGSWAWEGVGQPAPTCASVGFFPVSAPPGC